MFIYLLCSCVAGVGVGQTLDTKHMYTKHSQGKFLQYAGLLVTFFLQSQTTG